MVYTDEQLLDQLEKLSNLCGTLLAVALEQKGVKPVLVDGTRKTICDTYLNVSDTRDARGITR